MQHKRLQTDLNWRLSDESLYLTSMEGAFQMRDRSEILAEWVSGQIQIGSGKVVYTDEWYGDVHESGLEITIDKGNVASLATRSARTDARIAFDDFVRW